jgi:hypothetical protein
MSLFPGLDSLEARHEPADAAPTVARAPAHRGPATLSGVLPARQKVTLGHVGQVLHGWKVDLPALKASSACRAVDCERPRPAQESYCAECRQRFITRAWTPTGKPFIHQTKRSKFEAPCA